MSIETELMSQDPLFLGLSKESVEKFATRAGKRQFRVGDIIYAELTESTEVFFVLKGHVTMSIALANTMEPTDIDVAQGQFFGLDAFIDPGARSNTARAVQDTEALVWQGEDWREICEQDPKIGYTLALRVAKEIKTRAIAWAQKLADSVSWGLA